MRSQPSRESLRLTSFPLMPLNCSVAKKGCVAEHSQAIVDSRRCVQSEPDLPHPVGGRYPTGAEKSTVPAYVCAFFPIPSLFSTRASHKLFFFTVTTQTASESSLSQI